MKITKVDSFFPYTGVAERCPNLVRLSSGSEKISQPKVAQSRIMQHFRNTCSLPDPQHLTLTWLNISKGKWGWPEERAFTYRSAEKG